MNQVQVLIFGDIVSIGALTIIGFASHGELQFTSIPRMGTTFFPVLIAWFVLAPWFGLFDERVMSDRKLLWRVPLAMFLAAQIAAILRAAMLGSAALPLFATILGASFALGIFVWRAARLFIRRGRSKS